MQYTRDTLEGMSEDIMGGATTLSSMTTGLRMFKHQGGENH